MQALQPTVPFVVGGPPAFIRQRPWTFVAGVAATGAGAGVLVLGSQPLTVVRGELAVAVVLAFGVLELVAGAFLNSRADTGRAHLVAGTLELGLSLFLTVVATLSPLAFSPAPLALMIGLFCVINAIFRGLDAAVFRPNDLITQVVNAGVTLGLGVIAFNVWRGASSMTVDLLAGAVVCVGGIALVGSSRGATRSPVTASS